jgi:hypothetical protein
MPERRNPTESKCFVERRKQCASDEEFREDFKRTRQEKNSYHEVDHMKSKALMLACGLSLVLIIATAEPLSWRDGKRSRNNKFRRTRTKSRSSI